MGEPKVPLTVARSALVVLYTLAVLPSHGATYQGLAFALGIGTERGVRRAVDKAKEAGLVAVFSSGHGRGAKSVVRIAMDGARLLRQLGL